MKKTLCLLALASLSLLCLVTGCENDIIQEWYRPDVEQSVPELIQEDDYGCRILAYDFTRPPAVGFIRDGTGTEASPIPIDIVYPFGSEIPKNEEDIRIYYSGIEVESLGEWYLEAEVWLRHYVVTGKTGQKKYYLVNAVPGEVSGFSSVGTIGPFLFSATNGLIEGHVNTTAGSVAGVFVEPSVGIPPFTYQLENSTDIFELNNENGSWVLRMKIPLEARSPWVLRARITDSAGSYYEGPVQFTVFPPGTVRDISGNFHFIRSAGTLWAQSVPRELSGFFTAPDDGSGTAPFTYTLIDAYHPDAVQFITTPVDAENVSKSRDNSQFMIPGPGESMTRPDNSVITSPGNVLQIGLGGLDNNPNPYRITVKLEDSTGKILVESFTFSIAAARVMITNVPQGMRHYKAKIFEQTISFTAENFMDNEFTASYPPESGGIICWGDTYSQGGSIDIMLGGTAPIVGLPHSLILYAEGGDEYAVAYINGLDFNSENTAFANWSNTDSTIPAELWHAFTNISEFQAFMYSPDSAANNGQPYKLALANIDMTADLSWGQSRELYANFKAPYTYIFDFRGCTGAAFNSAPTHNMPEKIIEVYLPDTLTTLGASAFQNCTSLTYVRLPSSLLTIGDNAFKGCVALGATNFPQSITEIKTAAFANCRSLPSVDLNFSNIQTIGNSAFLSATSVMSLDLENSTLLKTVSTSAFKDCTALQMVNLKDCAALEQIQANAFRNCNNLETLTLNAVSSLDFIGDSAFEECNKLNAVNFSACAALKTISDRAFYRCTSLALMTLPGGSVLETVGERAFAYTALSAVDLSVCPLLNFLGVGVFEHCTLLTNANLDKTQITVIPASAFANDVQLQEVTLPSLTAPWPSKLETIGMEAFKDCVKLETANLTPVAATLTDIEESAFENCTKLETVNLSTCYNLETIGDLAFARTAALEESLDFPASPAPQLKTIGGHAFFYSGINNLDLREVKIPDFTIQAMAFAGSKIEHAQLSGSSIKTIGDAAFSGCTTLLTANLSSCTALTSIGDSAFQGAFAAGGQQRRTADISNCTQLATLGIELFKESKVQDVDFTGSLQIQNIPNNAFELCLKIDTVDLTGCTAIETLGMSSFMDSTIKNVVLDGTSVESIKANAFKNCEDLVNFDFPVIGPTLDTLEESAFENCIKLAAADFSLSVQPLTVKQKAFKGCSALETLKLPASTVLVEDQAFFVCITLTHVYIAISDPDTTIFPGTSTFASILSRFVLHVPSGSSDNWDFFWRGVKTVWPTPYGTQGDPEWTDGVDLGILTGYNHIVEDFP